MKGNSLGMMQGRLTPSNNRGIQFFPFDNWEREFEVAKEVGLNEIEFIFDYDRYEENPLWSKAGIEKICGCMKKTGVLIRAVCFDYFMRRPFFKANGEERKKLLEENISILKKVLTAMEQLGAHLIEIPLVDDSSMKTEHEKKEVICFLKSIFEGRDTKVRCGLETDLPPQDFKEFLEEMGMEAIGANYDSGNSSGLGYDPYVEITMLSSYIFNIHIKDREFKGTTKKLGTGSANFHQLFKALNEIDYQGSFILQAARGKDGEEKKNIEEQMAFVQNFMKLY